MTKPKAKTTTVIRKRKPRNKDLTKSSSMTKKLEALLLFCNGKTYDEISSTLGWEPSSVKLEISKIYKALHTLLETENLLAQHNADLNNVSTKSTQQIKLYNNQKTIDKDINSKFLEKLSGENDSVLSQEEILFSYLLVHEGDGLKALIDSGLSSGLVKSNSGYKRATALRILMLKGKKNIIKYINNLQISYAKELNINKEAIQSEIIRQLTQLKEQNNPKNAPTIAKLTEQLGRTVGAFSDKIVVEEVNFDQAMNKMLEMRKAKGTDKTMEQAIEASTYSYDPDLIG